MYFHNEMCANIAQVAIQSLLYEVSASPKPGLVDRYNQGAHNDMDFFSFMASTASLVCYFYKAAAMGVKYAGQKATELFSALRGLGIEAEKAMLKATGGVNTHKGLIFSLGLVSAATSCALVEQKASRPDVEGVCHKVAAMTSGICRRELEEMKKHAELLTHGERLYKKYGFKGIRGEAESGFATVRNHALPELKRLKSKPGISLNDLLVQVLLVLMAVNEDTNIAARHDQETLEDVKKNAGRVLEAGGMLTAAGIRMVYQMDQEFIKRNISPGGSADLLAVTVMLDLLSELKI